jgi:L-lysine 6-transaminase
MVRCQKYLEVIDEENLIKNSEIQGKRLLDGLIDLSNNYSDVISNARGKGLMCAFDLETSEKRDEFRKKIYNNGLVILGCGEKTIRFRPPLIISEEEIDKALDILKITLKNFT